MLVCGLLRAISSFLQKLTLKFCKSLLRTTLMTPLVNFYQEFVVRVIIPVKCYEDFFPLVVVLKIRSCRVQCLKV